MNLLLWFQGLKMVAFFFFFLRQELQKVKGPDPQLVETYVLWHNMFQLLKKGFLFWNISCCSEMENPFYFRRYITYIKIEKIPVTMQGGSLVCYISIVYTH